MAAVQQALRDLVRQLQDARREQVSGAGGLACPTSAETPAGPCGPLGPSVPRPPFV